MNKSDPSPALRADPPLLGEGEEPEKIALRSFWSFFS